MIGELTNHLWQSTVFAVAAGLLTVAFRENRAQVRYWLWLSASLKFFVPFSLLMSLGSHLQWAPAAKSVATQAVSFTMVQITEPFPDTLSFAPSAPRTTDWLLIAILGVWACGFVAIAIIRFKDWLLVRAAVRASTRVEIPAGVEVRSFPGLLEPGVVGLLRPVLLLPAGVLERLTPLQLRAVLAHELCHVRRRDNLTAALHMIVEAVFWFHPLVWWIGARLVEERERACDEEVLRLGSEPQVYAESILSVCKFYVESPLRCVSGVTGSDLKKRVVRIMKSHFGAALSVRQRFLLVAAGVVALAVPLVAGVLTAPRLRVRSATGDKIEAQAPAGTADRPTFGVASVIERVEVEGNRLIRTETLQARISMRPGDPYNEEGLRRDFQALWNTQYFEDVRLEVQDSPNRPNAKIVIFHVVERPIIRKIEYRGNKSITESNILDAFENANVGLAVEDRFDPTKIKEAEVVLQGLEASHGHQAATVRATYKAIPSTNAVQLIFTVDEGPLTKAAIAVRAAPLGGPAVPRPGAQAPAAQSPAAPTDRPKFDVASVKENKSVDGPTLGPLPGGRYTFTRVTLNLLITNAYQLKPQQLSGLPDWGTSEHFDIEAKTEGNPTRERNLLMLQSLLADRFKLVVHHETRQLPVYALVLSKAGKTGPQLTPHTDDSKCVAPSAGPSPAAAGRGAGSPVVSCGGIFVVAGGAESLRMGGQKVTIEMLTASWSRQLDRIVVDRTGLSGTFDANLQWTPLQPLPGAQPAAEASASDPSAPPSIFTALQEQLGLKLEAQTGPVDVLVIDHVEEPSPN